jgi:ribose-phosphate pyrophosphokinase
MKIIQKSGYDTLELGFKTFTFPGGEVGLKLNTNEYCWFDSKGKVYIISQLTNSEEFVRVAMAKDALEQANVKNIHLFCPYLPYARQDRVCDAGEAFSLKVFVNLLNSLNFQSVTIVDPHSDVTPALINNVKVISQFEVFQRWDELAFRAAKSVFISPDAGANKKTATLAGYFSHSEFIRADKLRDLSNGAIKETIVYADYLKGQDIFCADDLCDGGKTFIELAKVLKNKGAGKVILYATHGIFSKGFDVLFDGGIDEVWTTNSFRSDFDPRVKVLDLESIFI